MRELIGQFSLKEIIMKKTFLAILMILVLATAGLFAAVTIPGDVTATLNATIGEYLSHGFTVGTLKYQPAITVTNAFDATTPTFKYGYKTNASTGTFSFDMTVGDFIGSAGTVLIKTVTTTPAYLSHTPNSRVYQIFNQVGNGTAKTGEATIAITPYLDYTAGQVDIEGTSVLAINTVNGDLTNPGAPAGDYTASVLFSITAS